MRIPSASPHAAGRAPSIFASIFAPSSGRAVRALVVLAGLALLAACSGQRPSISPAQEAAEYKARARHNYTPPGPPHDPWGPYIVEASGKYDVPERWIREVVRAESSGHVFETSEPGAMGLMQVMPETYDELRGRYVLGDDAYDPHDNIMAGTAYLRELYDIYGSPGFLAAYNAGPGRLDDYLMHNRPLPDETRHYVAKIAPYIQDSFPQRLSPATQYAMNQIPIDIPPGPRYPHQRGGFGAPVALADNRSNRAPPQSSLGRAPIQTAALPEPPRLAPPPPLAVTYAAANTQPHHGSFHVIPQALADTVPVHHGGPVSGAWAIQVGAFANEGQARAAAEAARGQARDLLASAHPSVGSVRQGSGILFRARLAGLSRDAAIQACERLSRGRGACIVVSPNAQS